MRSHILALPIGLTAIFICYAARWHQPGLKRIAALISQLPNGWPVGVPHDDTRWHILVDHGEPAD